MCQQSTSASSPRCEFCGHAADERAAAAEDARLARRAMESPGTALPTAPVFGNRSAGEDAAIRKGELALMLAIGSLFCFSLLAPFAFVLGRDARRELLERGQPAGMATAGMVIGGIVSGLLAVALVTFALMFVLSMR